jgi:hypothetical protein
VYDPPIKGKEIYIYNQSDHPILALWLISEATLMKFDTVLINNRKFIQRRPNYVPEYGTFDDFISCKILEKASNNKSVIKYFIIDEVNSMKSANQISDSSNYKFLEINPDSVLMNGLNYIVFNDDTVILEHIHSLEFIHK